MKMTKSDWILCPLCKGKTQTRMLPNTKLENFPLLCQNCKKETIINVSDMNLTVVTDLDDASQGSGLRRWSD